MSLLKWLIEPFASALFPLFLSAQTSGHRARLSHGPAEHGATRLRGSRAASGGSSLHVPAQLLGQRERQPLLRRRVLGDLTVIAVSSRISRDQTSLDPTLMYLAILAFVLNILSIASWVNPRNLSALFLAKSNAIVNDKTLFLASLAVLIGQCVLVSKSSGQYSQLFRGDWHYRKG